MYAPSTEWNKRTGFARPSYPAVPADKSPPPLTLWTQDPATYRTDCCLGRRLTPERDPHWDRWVSMSYQCGKPTAAAGLCTGCQANKTKYEAPYKTRPPWHGLITEAPPPDTAIFWLASYRNHPTKKSMPKWCPDGYKAPVVVAAAVAKAPVVAAAPASPTLAPASVEPEPITGELMLVGGEFYWVQHGNVYEYDQIEEKSGYFVGRLRADETIDSDAEELVPEEPAEPVSALTLLAAAMARAKQEAEELSALRKENTALKMSSADIEALRAENAALKAKLASVKALFTA